jgi:acid phosphatase
MRLLTRRSEVRRATGVVLGGLVLAGLAALPAAPSASTQNRRLQAAIASGADPQTFGVPTPAHDPSARLLGPTRSFREREHDGAQSGGQADSAARVQTETPIKHVVVIIGENHTFDNVFATYRARHGQYVRDLLSEGIITANDQLGPNGGLARQYHATNTTKYGLNPQRTGPYATLPQPNTTSAQGQPKNVPDSRFPADLPNGPYQITKYVPYLNAFVGDPLHRFYQMAQEIGRNKNGLWTWVHQTAGDDNGANPPAAIHQGALEMGYYNVQQGDAPVLKSLADNGALADNYHQAVQGGTGANHVMIGAGQDAYYQDSSGNPQTPPSDQIENPNPKPGTNNNYTQDGYSGGTYSNCSDPSQPGVGPILGYLAALGRTGNCAPGAYYMLNNYNPGYAADGTVDHASAFTVSPQTFPTIGDELNSRGISWKYYGQGWNNGNPDSTYCNICNPFQYVGSIMTSPAQRAAHIQDVPQFEQDAAGGTLPAVTFLKPDGVYDGHPASSALSLFEQFTTNAIRDLQSNPKLWKSTAVIVTMDEGGGYYDSGYVQPVDFFGDGTRIPTIVVSPWARSGYVDHTYYDHVSILKFIERNWGLEPLSSRSRDNLPNPEVRWSNPYKPVNGPAIGDLFGMFEFNGHGHHEAVRR